MKEEDLKERGEKLATIAVENGVGSKQLTTLYKLAKTKPVPFIEVFVKRQIGRNVEGFDSFGPPMLDLLSEHGGDKGALQKILMYANMLYPYAEKEATMDMREEIDPVVKRIAEEFGYRDVEVSERRGQTEFRVKVARFHGDPAALAWEIEREIREKVPKLSRLRFRVWIERA